jgi:hypothetical protein
VLRNDDSSLPAEKEGAAVGGCTTDCCEQSDDDAPLIDRGVFGSIVVGKVSSVDDGLALCSKLNTGVKLGLFADGCGSCGLGLCPMESPDGIELGSICNEAEILPVGRINDGVFLCTLSGARLGVTDAVWPVAVDVLKLPVVDVPTGPRDGRTESVGVVGSSRFGWKVVSEEKDFWGSGISRPTSARLGAVVDGVVPAFLTCRVLGW